MKYTTFTESYEIELKDRVFRARCKRVSPIDSQGFCRIRYYDEEAGIVEECRAYRVAPGQYVGNY